MLCLRKVYLNLNKKPLRRYIFLLITVKTKFISRKKTTSILLPKTERTFNFKTFQKYIKTSTLNP